MSEPDYDGWRARVLYEDPLQTWDGALRLMLGRRVGRGAREVVLGIDPQGGPLMQRIEDAEGAETPTMILPTGMALALLDALSRHFGGTGDTRQLRKDHDTERARVDKLIATLSTVVTRGGQP